MKSAYRCIVLTGMLFATPAVMAQNYPTKPIRLVVPFAAGGGGDAVARPMIQKLSELLGQQVAIDNRGGANGNIGADHVAKSPADGYTLLFANSSLPISVTLYRKLPFDAVRDFTPISLVSVSPSVLVVHPSLPAKSVRELIALAKAQPGKLNYASGGTGTTMHLAAELLRTLSGIDIVHVPYKGAGPAIIDFIGGHVTVMFINIPPVLGQIQTGKARPLAVTTRKRATVLPDVPTMVESGLPDYESRTWYGIMGPAGLPRDIVTRLNKAVVDTVATPEVRGRLTAVGSEPETNTPAQFSTFFLKDIESWAKVVKASGATAD
jgi:tripartite-type tricarboxylate transporter receptor subunit TctC